MLLVRDRRDPSRLVARANRPWRRALSRLLAGSLDRQLAAGRAPEARILLASRAERLVAPAPRRALARLMEQHLEAGLGPADTARRGRLRPGRRRMAAVAPAVHRVAALLEQPGPVAVRGVALVSLLLTDGAGPLFSRHSEETLAAVLHRAAEQLDPARALYPAA